MLRRLPLQVRQYFKDKSFYYADVKARGFCDEGFLCEGFSASAATVKVLYRMCRFRMVCVVKVRR